MFYTSLSLDTIQLQNDIYVDPYPAYLVIINSQSGSFTGLWRFNRSGLILDPEPIRSTLATLVHESHEKVRLVIKKVPPMTTNDPCGRSVSIRFFFFWFPDDFIRSPDSFFWIPGSISRNPGSFLLIQGFFIVGFRIRIFFLTFNPLQSGILQQQKIGSAALKTFHAAVNVG